MANILILFGIHWGLMYYTLIVFPMCKIYLTRLCDRLDVLISWISAIVELKCGVVL
jgi:hypothetical protein